MLALSIASIASLVMRVTPQTLVSPMGFHRRPVQDSLQPTAHVRLLPPFVFCANISERAPVGAPVLIVHPQPSYLLVEHFPSGESTLGTSCSCAGSSSPSSKVHNPNASMQAQHANAHSHHSLYRALHLHALQSPPPLVRVVPPDPPHIHLAFHIQLVANHAHHVSARMAAVRPA